MDPNVAESIVDETMPLLPTDGIIIHATGFPMRMRDEEIGRALTTVKLWVKS